MLFLTDLQLKSMLKINFSLQRFFYKNRLLNYFCYKIIKKLGFPRTERQAEMLDSMHPVSLVINLEVPDSVVLERVRNRWTHLPSGRVYNIGFNDPKEPGKDDLTGERLCRRPDDEPQVVQQRLHEFKTKTSSVIRYYEKRGVLRSFAGITTDEMWSDIVEYIHNFFS